MRRFLQVLTLGATALLFTAAVPGIAGADQGRGGGRGGYYEDSKPYKPYYKPHKGHKKYGKYRRHKHRDYAEKRRRHHVREHRRHHRHDHFRHGHRHRHFGHRHRHDRHRHDHVVWPFIGLHFYPSRGQEVRSEPPPAYLPPPPAYPVEPAVVEQTVADAGAPSTCLMTREYQTEILVGGELVPAYGQACLQPDGSWYRGPAVPESY